MCSKAANLFYQCSYLARYTGSKLVTFSRFLTFNTAVTWPVATKTGIHVAFYLQYIHVIFEFQYFIFSYLRNITKLIKFHRKFEHFFGFWTTKTAVMRPIAITILQNDASICLHVVSEFQVPTCSRFRCANEITNIKCWYVADNRANVQRTSAHREVPNKTHILKTLVRV